MGLTKGGITGGAYADERMGRVASLGQQPLNMLCRAFILLMVELVDGPVQQLSMKIAVINGGAVYPVSVLLAVTLQIAGDAIVIKLATRGKTSEWQQIGCQPLALFPSFFFSLIFLALGRRMEQSL